MKKHHTFLFIITIVFFFSCKSTTQDKKDARVINLNKDWEVISDDSLSQDASKIASLDFTSEKTLKTDVPSTVFNAYLQNGYFDDVFFGMNMKKIDHSIFDQAFWFRKEFELETNAKHKILILEGIDYKAEIWINGKKLADTSQVKNPFRQFSFNVDDYLVDGKNVIAIKIYPAQNGDFNIGFVDWNPMAPDKEAGITRPIKLYLTEEVRITEPFIESVFDNEDFSKAKLNVSVKVENLEDKSINGVLVFETDGKHIEKQVSLKPKESKKILLSAADYNELLIKNPKLWYPYTIGTPYLYSANFKFKISGNTSDNKHVKYGIRKIEDFFTKEGHRGFKINGQKILIRGGGWVDNLFLNNTEDNLHAQLEYVKNMNLNTIRLEGFWGNSQRMYEIADSMGILVMVGWSCHWEWEDYLGKTCHEQYGGITSPEDIDLISDAWQDQIVWLRNHPSIFTWMAGSDKIPAPELEKKYLKTLEEYDTTRVYLSSAKEWTSLTGNSGVKMRGPYEVVPPVYWYEDTANGGAFGFNTETGPGAQVPPLWSIKKMIPAENLWPIDSVWEFHCGRNEFNTLKRYNKCLFERYGQMNSVEEYAYKAQAMNYELIRPMFEAFSLNRYKSTGVIQWMLNSAWPEMYWQLYDYYLMPNGAFYGTKKAGNPVHAVYNYANQGIYIVNDLLNDIDSLNVLVRIYDINSTKIFEKAFKAQAKANSSVFITRLPDVKTRDVYFLSILTTKNSSDTLDNNFYWLSPKNDILDYSKSDWFYTPFIQYADFTSLNKLTKVDVRAELASAEEGNYTEYKVTLTNNTDKIAFFVNVELIDKNTGDVLLPVLWSDNYVSLLPNEKRILKAKINNKYLKDKNVDLQLSIWNNF